MIIDVHAHLSPKAFPADPGGPVSDRWPCMVCSGGQNTLTLGAKPFRDLDDRSWCATRRLEDMDREGITRQVLSPMPELLSYWMPENDADILLDHVNHQIAEVVASAPQRFSGLGAVTLQNPKRAAAQVRSLRRRFGLCGVEVGSNINGVLLGDPRFDPFFAAIAEEGLSVFVHALHPIAAKAVNAAAPFTVFAGFPTDVGMTAASLILSGILTRHPGLRIGLSHGGGTLASTLGRLDMGWARSPELQARIGRPSVQAAQLFYDSNTYDPAYAAYLAGVVAPGHVFAGTDYPYDVMQRDLKSYLQSISPDPQICSGLMSGAAMTFLGLGDA